MAETSQTALETTALPEQHGPIKYTIEYIGQQSGSFTVDKSAEPSISTEEEPLVFEHVDVRFSGQVKVSTDVKEHSKTEKAKGHAYITILSPAVAEALRCVVDYFPGIDFSSAFIKIKEPYTVFVFFEHQLTAYRKRLETADAEQGPLTCANRWAAKHIAIIQKFVYDQTHEAVEAERARHARGFATFDMLWLLYKPGEDAYFDTSNVNEHEPHVIMSLDFTLTNGTTNSYVLSLWNLKADSNWVGASMGVVEIRRFAGEKAIVSLAAYPCNMLSFMNGMDSHSLIAIQEHFTRRGKKWYDLRRKVQTYRFDGYTSTFPRRHLSSLIVVDPIQYQAEMGHETASLLNDVTHPSSPKIICKCSECNERIYRHAVKPKFSGYSRINPLIVDNHLTDHQYFLCDCSVEAFVFKVRDWVELKVEGFQAAMYDETLFERLVLKESTKQCIQSLTQMYMKGNIGSSQKNEEQYTKISEAHMKHTAEKTVTTWSADLIEGKGEGLILLLHGQPGVGKTYTAECIAEFTKRPLLSLTCADIGVDPATVEKRLIRWFKLAQDWGAIMLIDEADIYMEQRQVQDIQRNHLVAGFLRSLEYYKGMLFLTTNRVGTFDEAFMSRIHTKIHYPNFDEEDRDKLWDSFFQKLEVDRETTMRITQPAKDYVSSQDLRALKWNGREIRNAFQVAVALAEAQGHKDNNGRVLVKPDHIRATVQMSKEFQEYLVKLHKGDLSKRASLMGNRYDAYGKEVERTDKH